jgi:2-polyprenyl-6-methoxyphenol hydroxylase-like FAD-dependent oxidoreductase
MSTATTPKATTLPGQGTKILISGGSIAGPTIAWWLNKYDFETTIVERWHELRPGGQNIDVRGVGVSLPLSHPRKQLMGQRDIITKMGLFDAVKARNTTEAGFQLVNASGRALVSIPAMANGPTAELEILRGDFAGVLYEATKEGTRYLFGDSISGIDDEVNGSVSITTRDRSLS